METRENLELLFLLHLLEAVNHYESVDGRKVISAYGNKYDVEKIEQRAKELIAKFMEPYKI